MTHVVAMIILWLVGFSVWLSIILSLLIIGSCYWLLTTQALRSSATAVTQLYKNTDNSWSLYTKKGTEWRGVLRADSLHTRYLLILNFKVEQRRFSRPVVICADALSYAEFRRLRLSLAM